MKSQKKKLVFFLSLLSSIGLFLVGKITLASGSGVIINELQIAGEKADDEFIELYNPTDQALDLKNFKLTKKSASGTESNLVSSTAFGGIIPAHGYFLISHPDYKEAVAPDLVYSGSSFYIAANNTVILYENSGKIMDKVGYGTVIDFETAATENPAARQSLERKNFLDTDNNREDFIFLDQPTPRSSVFIEDVAGGDPPPVEELPGAEEKCAGDPVEIKINEVYPNPENEEDEFVELKNSGGKCVDISGWKIMDEAGHVATLPEGAQVEAGAYFYLQKKLYLNNDADTIYLLNKSASEKSDSLDKVFYEYKKSAKNYSYGLAGANWRWSSEATPGKENEFEKEPEKINYTRDLRINEIFPNPEESPEGKFEFIEIFNIGTMSVDLAGWKIKDKTGEFSLAGNIPVGSFLAFFDTISLNNSGEDIFLIDPSGEVADSLTYTNSLEGLSFSLMNNAWKWSNLPTPGAENKNKQNALAITLPEKIFINQESDFGISFAACAKQKSQIIWDFGDGHKSYKEKTSHRYKKLGTYKVTVWVSCEKDKVFQEWEVLVEDLPHPKVAIVEIAANPEGKDAGNEWLKIKNKSAQAINLKNWSIATGWKKLVNHPIRKELTLAPGEIKKITRKQASFTLVNQKGKIELRYPDKEVADEVKYQKKKKESVSEGEIYMLQGKKWKWIKNSVADKKEEATALESENNLSESSIFTEEQLEEKRVTEILENIGKISSESNKAKNKMTQLVFYGTKFSVNQYFSEYAGGRVLGIDTFSSEKEYHFSGAGLAKEHYAKIWLREIFWEINSRVNSFFYLFNR